MTTIVADGRVGLMGADTFCDGGVGYQAEKLIRCKQGVFGCSGDDTIIARFEYWITGRTKKKPEQLIGAATEDFQALQMHDGQIFIWDGAMRPVPSLKPYAAVGSGAAYALGALDAGASIQEALRIASERDSGTKPPFTFIEL